MCVDISSTCTVCDQAKYCSMNCQQDAWKSYHKDECSLGPLLEMVRIMGI